MSLRHAASKAYKSTDVYTLRKLFAQESRWKRKVTIATNKLADVRDAINKLAETLASQKVGITPDTSTDNSESAPPILGQK